MKQDGRGRVLVVDDRPEMAEAVADGLFERGYAAIAVASGRSALQRLAHDRIDVVVTELRLPDGDGLRVLDASRRLDPARPVIIMTSDADIEEALLASGHGAYQYLIKPFRIGALERVLESALRDGRPPHVSQTTSNGG
jgi:two-component system response regulator GlrR